MLEEMEQAGRSRREGRKKDELGEDGGRDFMPSLALARGLQLAPPPPGPPLLGFLSGRDTITL